MKAALAALIEKPGKIAILGSISGWFSWEQIAHAKDAAQFAAAALASLVSVCALIISAPKAIAILRNWRSSFFTRQ